MTERERESCHSEEQSDEESQAIAHTYYGLHPDKRDSQAEHGIGKPYVGRPER